ncbi:MAG TPA: hypothetical protein PKB03_02905 [Baekduia sp.]|nr:hypothetical protein [Baekduia sp.]
MRNQVLQLATQTTQGPVGTFAVIADAARPESYVQWIRDDEHVVRIEVPIEDEARAELALSMGYHEDIPNYAQDAASDPEVVTDLVMNTIDAVLGGIEEAEVTFQLGEEWTGEA